MKKTSLCGLICIVLLIVFQPSLSAQTPSKEYQETVRVLMEVSGQNATAYTMVPQVILMIKAQHPNIPDEYWQQLLEKMKEKFIDRMVELIAPIYQKYLTLSDLKQIVAFYQTPVGKKLGEAVPSISMDSMQLGQKIGVEIVQEIQQDVKSYEQYL